MYCDGCVYVCVTEWWEGGKGQIIRVCPLTLSVASSSHCLQDVEAVSFPVSTTKCYKVLILSSHSATSLVAMRGR